MDMCWHIVAKLPSGSGKCVELVTVNSGMLNYCCHTERSVPGDEVPSDVAECDAGTAAADAELEVKCSDEDDSAAAPDGADSLPAAVSPSADTCPCYPSTVGDAEPASADDTSESVSVDASPTHSSEADRNSNSVDSLVTDAVDTCISSESAAAGD